MYLIALAWAYVVLLMALAEAMSPQGSVLGAFFTLMLYGVLPLSIVLFVFGTPYRRRARRAAEAAAAAAESAPSPESPHGRTKPAADAVAPVREEA